MSESGALSHERVRDFLDPILGADLHAKRIASLADATTGALRAASLAVCAIGAGLAAAKGLNPKHAGKQVDRMLSNPGIDLDAIFPLWVNYIEAAARQLDEVILNRRLTLRRKPAAKSAPRGKARRS